MPGWWYANMLHFLVFRDGWLIELYRPDAFQVGAAETAEYRVVPSTWCVLLRRVLLGRELTWW